MAENVKILRERLALEKEIKEIKAKAANDAKGFSDQDARDLREKEARIRAIKKIESQASKEKDAASSKLYGLQSRVNELQDNFVKSLKVGNREILQTGLGFEKIRGLIPKDSLGVFVTDILRGKDAVKELEEQLEELSSGESPLDKKLQSSLDTIKEAGITSKGIDYGIEQHIIDRAKKFAQVLPMIDDELKHLAKTAISTGLDTQKFFDKTIEMRGKLYESQDDLGGDDFTSMVKEAEKFEKVGKLTLANLYREISSLGEVNDSIQDKLNYLDEIGIQTVEEQKLRDDLTEKLNKNNKRIAKTRDLMEEVTDKMKENVEEAKRLEEMNTKIKNSVEFISKPFDALLSAMEKLPGGKILADLTGMRAAVDTFKEGATKAFKEYGLQLVKNQSKGKAAQLAANKEALAALGASLKTSGRAAAGAVGGAFKGLAAAIGTVGAVVLAVLGVFILIGLALRAVVKYAEEMRKETGATREEAFGMQMAISTTARNFQYLGVEAAQVKEIAQGIMESMGGMRNVTQENLDSMARLTAEFGMAPGKIAPAVTMLKAMGASSNEMATSQLEQIGNMAQLEGVAPAAIFEDMTSDMEFFAKYGKDSGMNMAKAAITARKLGINMAAIASSAESLLDFESSIQSQMEAVMLTGRNINTDRARQLALEGDIEGQAKEIARQVGTQAQFDAMNTVQREAMAKAFGIQVSDLAKMVANQEELSNMTLAERIQREEMQKRNKELNKGMADLGKEFGQIFNQLMIPLKELLIALGPTMGVVLKGLSLLIKLTFAPFIWILGYINKAIQYVGKLTDGVGELLSPLDTAGEYISKFGKYFGLISVFISPFTAAVYFVALATEALYNNWDGLVSFMKSSISVASNFIKNTWSKLVTGIGNMWNTYVTIPITRLGLWWDYTVIKMRQGFKDFSDYVVQGIINIGRKIVSPFVKLVDVIKSLGEKIKNVVMNPIASLKGLLRGILPNWALKLLGMGGSDATKEVMGEMQGPPTRGEAFREEFRTQRDAQGRGGEFEFGDEMFSTNYKEEGYDVRPQSSLAGAPTSARMSGTVTATTMRIQNGQVTELSSMTREIKKGNDKLNEIANSADATQTNTAKSAREQAATRRQIT